MVIRGVLYLDNSIIVNSFGINPVIGGKPAKEINKIDIVSCVVGEIIEIFLSCLDVVKFIEFIKMNSGIIREQYTIK